MMFPQPLPTLMQTQATEKNTYFCWVLTKNLRFTNWEKDLYLQFENFVINKVNKMEYTAIIEKMPSGWYIAQCEQVPGALTQGRTLEEVRENLKEAIFLVLEAEKELGITRHLDKTIIRRELVTV